MYTLLSQSSLSAHTNDENNLERRQAPSDLLSLLKDDMTNNNISMPDRTCPGITTSAHSIGNTQDGCAKLATGTKEILTTLTQKITITKRTLQLPTNISTLVHGTYVVRTLRRTGKRHELTRELDRYRWEIIGLAET